MPGSIQVSVLDFKELPSSANLVKVSLGNVEHEAGEKEIFSFPLTNLRDNLIISVQDSEGNQISHSGIRTMSIIEKGTWDDLFPVEGGGFIHMKLQFILSDEERNRIRSMREAAMKKKQAEILGSRLRKTESAKSLTSSLQRHEVSDVLRGMSSQDFQRSSSNIDGAKTRILTPPDDNYEKAAESSHVIKEESFQTQSFTDPTYRKQETSFPPKIESQASVADLTKKNEAEKPDLSGDPVNKSYEQNLEEKSPSDIKITSKGSTSTSSLQEIEVNTIKNNELQLQESVHQQEILENTNTRVFESRSLDNEKLKKQNREEKIQKTEPSTSSQETQVNKIKNNEEILQEASSQDMTSSRSNFSEKVKSFSPKEDNQGTLEKTPRNIKKMISVFESSISQDRAPLTPLSMKSYKVGSLRFKDNNQKSETSSSTRLRTSFSTGDLRKNLAIKSEQDGFDKFIEPIETNITMEPSETKDAKELNDTNGTKNLPNNEEKRALVEINTKKLPEACEEDATVSGRKSLDNENIEHIKNESVNGGKTSKDNNEYFSHDGDCKTEENDHQEKIVASIPEIVVKNEVHYGNDDHVKEGEERARILENLSPKSADEKASNGSFGQAIKVAIVVGFGVLVFLLRQREPGKSKKKENKRALKNQVFMHKFGATEEQRIKIGVMKLS